MKKLLAILALLLASVSMVVYAADKNETTILIKELEGKIGLSLGTLTLTYASGAWTYSGMDKKLKILKDQPLDKSYVAVVDKYLPGIFAYFKYDYNMSKVNTISIMQGTCTVVYK